MSRRLPQARAVAICAAAFGLAAAPSSAADLIVEVLGSPSGAAGIGCALFRSADGFPSDRSFAVAQQRAEGDAPVCRFDGLAPGRYAVAVGHDANDNGRTDTNFVGIPTEAWGVTNNVRPTLRAPRFDEAAIELDGAARTVRVEIRR